MISTRTKKNIALAITILGGCVLVARILQALLASESMSLRQWFGIFGAAVITACMFNIYRNFAGKMKRD